jgi:hypothetical protein
MVEPLVRAFLPVEWVGVIMRVLIVVLTGSLFATAPAMAQSRGALLYATHCIACHTTEVHWRDQRSASDWPALKAQVRRWQDAASLAWGDDDILAVSRYLNDSVYHFDRSADVASFRGLGGQEPASTLAWLMPRGRP